MVPGIAERERLAADLRRAEWLAEAMIAPVLADRSSDRSETESHRRLARLLASTLALVRVPKILRPKPRVTARRAASAGR